MEWRYSCLSVEKSWRASWLMRSIDGMRNIGDAMIDVHCTVCHPYPRLYSCGVDLSACSEQSRWWYTYNGYLPKFVVTSEALHHLAGPTYQEYSYLPHTHAEGYHCPFFAARGAREYHEKASTGLSVRI
jgi:hypothetical protein